MYSINTQHKWYEKLTNPNWGVLMANYVCMYESQNMYDSHTNTTILSRTLCVYFACYLCFLFLLSFLNAAANKTVNVDIWFESLESFKSITSIFLMYKSQWVGVWIKHISNVMSLKSMLYSWNESEYLNFNFTHLYSEFNEHLWVAKKKKTIHCWSLICMLCKLY